MIAWMLYCVLVSALVAVGARAAEWVGRSARYPARWVWFGALLFTLALAVLAPYRGTTTRVVSVPASLGVAKPFVVRPAASSWAGNARIVLDSFRDRLNAPLLSTAQAVLRRLPEQANIYALAAWSLVSAALFILFVLVQLRFRRARRDWPLANLHGVRVRVSPNVGPVVIGVARPEIVVPHWLLARDADEQHLVVTHEVEHVRARDTLVLGGACAVVAVMPWNPAVWYMLSRLRLAVELDCDARVLRGGAAPRSYGALLIDVAENNSGFRLGAPALTDDSSHLRQRIMAMKTVRPKFALVRGSVVGAFALLSLLAACEANLPTAADVSSMDAASAERSVAKLGMLKESGAGTVYLVDGKVVTAREAQLIVPDSIATIDIRRSGEEPGQISIRTNGRALSPERTPPEAGLRVALKNRDAIVIRDDTIALPKSRGTTVFRGDSVAIRTRSTTGPQQMNDAPLVYIDGVRSDVAAIKRLNRSDIDQVEVLKGSAAATYVHDPEAANGVIVITTKKASARK